MSLSSTNEELPIYERPVELLQHLIRFDTTNLPGNERECVEWIDGVLVDSRRTWRRDSANLKPSARENGSRQRLPRVPDDSSGAAHVVYSNGIRTDCCVEL
jgi:hypothetical protein